MIATQVALVPLRVTTDTENLAFPKGVGEKARQALFTLIVEAAATEVGDILAVKLQHSYDRDNATPVWSDFARFTNVLGNGGAKQFTAIWTRDVTGEIEHGPPNTALAQNSVLQGPLYSDWRAVATVTDAGTDNASFRWRLEAELNYE